MNEIQDVKSLRTKLFKGKIRPFVVLTPPDSGVISQVEAILKEFLQRSSAHVMVHRYSFTKKSSGKKALLQLKEAIKEISNLTRQQGLFGDSHLFILMNYPANAVDEVSQLLDLSGDMSAFLIAVEIPKYARDIVDVIKGHGHVIAIRNLANFQARSAISAAAKMYGISLSSDAVDALIELVGHDRGYIESAVRMLSTVYKGNQVLRAADIKKVITKRTKVMPWDLTDAIGGRDVVLTIKYMRLMLGEGNEPLKLYYSINRYIQQLVVALSLSREKDPVEAIQKALKIPKFTAQKLFAHSRNFTQQELKIILANMPLWEKRIKINMSDPVAVLTTMLTSIVVKR